MSSLEGLTMNELYYLKGMRILVNASALELRRAFKNVWNKQNPQNPWKDNQHSGILFCDNHKPSRPNPRYDDQIKTGRRGDWDMTVLCRVFIDYSFCADSKYRDNVKKLRDLRNIYSHLNLMSRSQDEFETDLEKVRRVFQTLGLSEDILEDAMRVGEGKNQDLRSEMTSLCRELHQEVLEELHQMQHEMHRRFDGLETRLVEDRDINTNNRERSRKDSSSAGKDKLPDWFSCLPETFRHNRVTEQDLVKLVKHIGGNWELVAVELGIKKQDREKAIATHRSVDLQMIEVFMKWVQKESRKATREAFIKALFDCNDMCTIDWDGIEEEFEVMSK